MRCAPWSGSVARRCSATCRARAAIPQFVRGHGARLRAIGDRVAQHPGLTLLGNGYQKVSVVGQWTAEGSRA